MPNVQFVRSVFSANRRAGMKNLGFIVVLSHMSHRYVSLRHRVSAVTNGGEAR